MSVSGLHLRGGHSRSSTGRRQLVDRNAAELRWSIRTPAWWRHIRSTLVLLVALSGPAMAAPVGAHELSPDQLHQVSFRQHPGDNLPLDLSFTDEYGQAVTLGSYFTSPTPVLLTMNYFHCQNLCEIELQDLVDGLNGVPFTLGNQYTLLTVSFDPRDTPHDAAIEKFRAFRGYVHPEASDGWHLLTTNDQATIDRLTQAVGFQYVYDAQEDDYAHPAGVVVVTPQAQISRYIYGLDFSATDLRLGLVEAAADHIGSVIDQVLLVCYHYDPIAGRYTPLVMNLLKLGGGATLLLVGGVLFLWWRADVRRGSQI